MSECPPQLPNAETALAWLPPDIAAQLQASSYLYVAVLGAWIWDFLMSSWQEFTMLTKYRFSFPQVAYIIAR
ncbi:hypothetical protein EW026_g5641 [Hermanssonia centrifuga]|uniref:Uncharacterized protein n=1 Tax=Hermanssonia centrifuga TaxID=98765 RepID=A0A4S4KDH7_9APHY|nr:hypothetical protein EW026_g5641 [Hermanssonia centrifuga]